MKKRRGFTFLVFVLITTFVLAACGGGDYNSGGGSAPMADYEYLYEYDAEDGFSTFGRLESRLLAENNANVRRQASGPGETSGSEEHTVPIDRKIIRNASLEIMADDASSLYQSIVDYGESLGGYENSYSITNYELYSVIHAEFKIPPEQLGAFVNFVGENGDIINSSMNSQDITDNYFDAAIRLDTKRRSLERYYKLLMQAKGVEEIVYIQRIIDQVTEDIEALEGRLRVWDSQVNMSTVSLYIRQNNDPLQIRKEISWNTLSTDDMGYLIKQGFFSITNTIVSLLQWAIVILIGYSPLWFLLIIGVFLWMMIRKKRPAKSESELESGEKKSFLRFKK